MTMAMISPSRRDVSPAEQLCRSPRLVPPMFRLVAAKSRPESLLMIIFGQKTSYSRRWAPEGQQGAHEAGGAQGVGRAPPSCPGCGPPLVFLPLSICYYFQKQLSWNFRTFGVVQNRSLIFAPFPAQNSSCRHSPSLCKPCKIRENRHKYCDKMCNNSP